MRLIETVRAVGFDLDGTLVDTVPDLADAANRMLERLSLAPLPEARIAAMVGAGIDALVARALAERGRAALNASQLESAANLFRELYAERVFARSRVYEGVADGLERLSREGLALCCITNKAGPFTRRVLDAAGLAPHFAAVLCADRPEQRKPAPALLHAACSSFGVRAEQLVYVGDSALDVAAARAAHCPVALVDYGYRGEQPLAQLGADWIVASIAEVVHLPAQPQATDSSRHPA